MPASFRGKLVITKNHLWYAALALTVSACIGFSVLIWLSGAHDTDDAFATGRRVLLVRETLELVGKNNSTEPPKTEAVKEEKPQEAPKEPEKSEEPAKPADSAAAEKPPEEKPAEDKAPEPAAPEEKKPEAVEAAPAEEPKESKIVPGEELPMSAEQEVEVVEESVTIVPSKNPLPDTNDKLVEKKPVGLLPTIGADGTKPWRYYAKPFERKGKQPMIAIIITGLGQSKSVTEKALVLPENFTLSFTPYSREAPSWAATARLTAHEKMVDLPMQPTNYPAADPGPYGLIVEKGLQENETRMQWAMSRFTGHVGFVTPHNEMYTHNDEAFKVLLQSLANRGLMLVMAHEPAKSETKDMLETSSTANVISDMLVDEELLENSIQTRLTALEQLATKRGYAIGIAQATPMTMEQLRIWSETLAEKGIALVPVSAVAKLRFS